jgi:DNA-binding response OmpR family regulator
MLPRVLVIEDDGDLRRLLRRGLEEEGFEVVQASLGRMEWPSPRPIVRI